MNRLRIGSFTNEDVEVLKSRILNEKKEKKISNACNLYFTNAEVAQHNEKRLAQLHNGVVTLPAVCNHPNGYKPTIMADGTIDSSPLLKSLKIKIGARIMITLNVDVLDGIVNGSLGTVTDMIMEENDPSVVKCIIVAFDNEKCGSEQRKKYPELSKKGTPVFRKKLEYQLGAIKNSQKPNEVRGTIYQFAMKLAFSLTGHKMQVIKQ